MPAPQDADSTARFTGLADIYAQARPSYPDAAIQLIIEAARAEQPPETLLIADVGCGTGISSRLLAKRGCEVIGIEPNEDMRRKAQADAANGGKLTYRDGTAEATGLDEGSVHLVVCAQAFHWFRPDEALREFARILVKGGWLSLIWNERAESDPFTRAYGDALRQAPQTAKVEMHRAVAGEVIFSCPLFKHATKHVFANSQTLDENGAIQRAFSASYAPQDVAGAQQWRSALQAAFQRYNKDGHVEMRYETSVYLAHAVT